MAADLGIFPKVAEPLVMVAPLAVIIVEELTPVFLKPKEPVAVDRPIPEGGFFPSSPLLFPASEGERWMEAPFRGVFTFSEALASSVFPKEEDNCCRNPCLVDFSFSVILYIKSRALYGLLNAAKHLF